jgi:hypothetical protein
LTLHIKQIKKEKKPWQEKIEQLKEWPKTCKNKI